MVHHTLSLHMRRVPTFAWKKCMDNSKKIPLRPYLSINEKNYPFKLQIQEPSNFLSINQMSPIINSLLSLQIPLRKYWNVFSGEMYLFPCIYGILCILINSLSSLTIHSQKYWNVFSGEMNSFPFHVFLLIHRHCLKFIKKILKCIKWWNEFLSIHVF